jgi:hypothetical protein
MDYRLIGLSLMVNNASGVSSWLESKGAENQATQRDHCKDSKCPKRDTLVIFQDMPVNAE